jgi:hypothetical protein
LIDRVSRTAAAQRQSVAQPIQRLALAMPERLRHRVNQPWRAAVPAAQRAVQHQASVSNTPSPYCNPRLKAGTLRNALIDPATDR